MTRHRTGAIVALLTTACDSPDQLANQRAAAAPVALS